MSIKSTSLKAIAYELNISINTVSRALRDCDDISDSTKEKVRQKAFELGYLPNNISQFIKRDGKQLIAVVLNSLKNMYFSIVCEKLVNIIAENKHDFTIVYSQTETLTIDVLKQCISQRVDGIITLLEPDDESIESAKMYDIPIVLIGRKIEKEYVHQIYTDDVLGGQLAANYLANYHRVEKFIYIKMEGIECSSRRENAFVSTLKNLSDKNEVLILEYDDVEFKIAKLINKGFLGIFCFNDEIAYNLLKKLNLEIPNVRKVYPHLHIIGYDCVSTRVNGIIDLTSIDFNYDDICSKAFEILLSCFAANSQNQKIERQLIKFSVAIHQRKYV